MINMPEGFLDRYDALPSLSDSMTLADKMDMYAQYKREISVLWQDIRKWWDQTGALILMEYPNALARKDQSHSIDLLLASMIEAPEPFTYLSDLRVILSDFDQGCINFDGFSVRGIENLCEVLAALQAEEDRKPNPTTHHLQMMAALRDMPLQWQEYLAAAIERLIRTDKRLEAAAIAHELMENICVIADSVFVRILRCVQEDAIDTDDAITNFQWDCERGNLLEKVWRRTNYRGELLEYLESECISGFYQTWHEGILSQRAADEGLRKRMLRRIIMERMDGSRSAAPEIGSGLRHAISVCRDIASDDDYDFCVKANVSFSWIHTPARGWEWNRRYVLKEKERITGIITSALDVLRQDVTLERLKHASMVQGVRFAKETGVLRWLDYTLHAAQSASFLALLEPGERQEVKALMEESESVLIDWFDRVRRFLEDYADRADRDYHKDIYKTQHEIIDFQEKKITKHGWTRFPEEDHHLWSQIIETTKNEGADDNI